MKHICPITKTMKFLSKKWALLILKELKEEKRNFFELMKDLDGISTATLSKRLKEMEKNGIIYSKKIKSAPPKKEYFLTKKGIELVKIFDQVAKWSHKYNR
ncbi:MAG: helix-turn-helix domain-containing protein [Candidatus Aenigmatarchaeota archaeon]